MVVFDKVVLLFTILAEVYMLWDFFNSCFEKRECVSAKKQLVVFVVTMVSILAINMMENSYINLFVAPVLYYLFTLVIFDVPFITRIIYVFIAWLILFFGEIVLVLLLEIPAYFLKASTVTNLADMTWFIFAVKLMSYFIFVIAKQLSKLNRHRMPTRIFFMYICQPVVSIIIMIVTYYSNSSVTFTSGYKVIMTVTFALLLFANILMFYAFNQYALQMSINMEQEVKLLKQEADKEHYAQLADMNEKHRNFIHDANNHFSTIRALAREGETEKIIRIADECVGTIQKSRIRVYSDHPVVNAILNDKIRQAEEKNICFTCLVDANAEIINSISDGDIVCILGNLLDNAIRAAEDCDRSKAYIEFKMRVKNKGSVISVEIKNSYNEQPVRGESGFISTKKDKENHGIGLKNVRQTVGKYEGLFECWAKNGEFVATVGLKVNIR